MSVSSLISLLLTLLLSLHPQALQIAFTNLHPPPNFIPYNPVHISPSTTVQTASHPVPLPFRRRVTNPQGFVYKVPLDPAVYNVTFGLLEFHTNACAIGRRIFSLAANTLSTANLDVFATVGCNQPLFVTLDNVPVTTWLKIYATPVSGLPPFLSNLRITYNRPLPISQQHQPSPSPSPHPTIQPNTVLTVDAAGRTDLPQYIVGNTSTYPNVYPIAGTINDAKLSKHRFGSLFSYVVPVPPNVVYSVHLFFAESFLPACTRDFRVFQITVHDAILPISTGTTVHDIDVFKRAGCRTQYKITLDNILIRHSGLLAIIFRSTINNAMISAFTITTTDPNYVPAQTPSSSPAMLSRRSEAEYNIGGDTDIWTLGSRKISSSDEVLATGFAPASFYKTARIGSDFTLSLHFAPGVYDITIGFVEFQTDGYCEEAGKRVFNVYINDEIQLEGYDIFASVGCLVADERTFEGQTVSTMPVRPLTIRFSSIVNFASVSYIRVRKSTDQCRPLTSNEDVTADHAAHSVPGFYPSQISRNSARSYVDSDGDGFVTVDINGDRSHTHFFDSANNVPGKITDYTWSLVESGEVISRRVSFSYNFPLGTTRFKLAVVDNACTSDEAETSVTVVGAIRPGQYCYYYKGLTEIPSGGSLMDSPSPSFARIRNSAFFGFPRFSFDNTLFSVRCHFFLQTDKDERKSEISITTGESGLARVYKGTDLILDSESTPRANTSLPVGLTAFEVVYIRKSLESTPRLAFRVNGVLPNPSKISHDRSTIRPIISELSPSEGRPGGGARVKVTGYGLYQPLSVTFGGVNVDVLPSGADEHQFFVISPPMNSTAPVTFYAKSPREITSNGVTFDYGSTCDSIRFSQARILTPRGLPVNFLQLPTCVTIGQDGKLYMGTLGGTVQVLGYDSDTLTSTSHCYSKPVVDMNFVYNGTAAVRDILGITFDPRDKVMMPYISTGTLFWKERLAIDPSNTGAWRNGAVDRMRPGRDPEDRKICMVYDKRIVSGLPVSNHDHGVSALLFAQNGDLLVSVGGFTNMGLPGYKLGGLWETSLSAAILVVKLSKHDFDGNITYSNADEPRHAKQISGDVHVFASGVRNAFAMTMTGSGNIYATDQGPNCGFGDTASTCHDYDEANATRYDPTVGVDWEGKVAQGWESCPFSLGRPDKVVHVTKGAWFGHPNIQRGGNECAWIDPYDGQTADNKSAPDTYRRAMAMLNSPVTGIGEYRSNHFCGRLRGELILSSYKLGPTYRMRVEGGKRISGPDEILETGGITFVENAHGNLIFPRLQRRNVFVMKVISSRRRALFISGAVPFRHGRNGGTRITIGGSNFGPLPTVWIGGGVCDVIKSSDREIICRVPEGAGLNDLEVNTLNGRTEILTDAVLYMDA